MRSFDFSVPGGQVFGGGAAAISIVEDVIITGPTPNATFSGALNFDLGGIYMSSLSNGSGPFDSANGQAEILVTARLSGPLAGGGKGEASLPLLIPLSGDVTRINDEFQTPALTFAADPNTPFKITLELSVEASIGISLSTGTPHSASGIVSADFSNSLSLPDNRPVIDFGGATGFTVNSESANIVDNVFQPTAVVPLPPAISMMALGLAALGLLGVARGRRRDQAAA